MRRVLVALASAALLGGIALTTTVASAHEGGEDMHYIAKGTSFEHSKLGDGGHQIVVNFDLFDHHHDGGAASETYSAQDHGGGDEPVGHGVATCVTANVGEGILCTGNIMVDDGQISSQGIVHKPSHHAAGHGERESHSAMLPITGGSGMFVDAAGELEISHEKSADGGETSAAAPSALRALRLFGMSPDDSHGGGKGHKGGHALHLIYHLQ